MARDGPEALGEPGAVLARGDLGVVGALLHVRCVLQQQPVRGDREADPVQEAQPLAAPRRELAALLRRGFVQGPDAGALQHDPGRLAAPAEGRVPEGPGLGDGVEAPVAAADGDAPHEECAQAQRPHEAQRRREVLARRRQLRRRRQPVGAHGGREGQEGLRGVGGGVVAEEAPEERREEGQLADEVEVLGRAEQRADREARAVEREGDGGHGEHVPREGTAGAALAASVDHGQKNRGN